MQISKHRFRRGNFFEYHINATIMEIVAYKTRCTNIENGKKSEDPYEDPKKCMKYSHNNTSRMKHYKEG